MDAEIDDIQKKAHVLSLIRTLHTVEENIRTTGLIEMDKLSYRREHSKEIVETLFAWIENKLQHPDLLPKSLYAKALNYIRNRQAPLQEFLGNPQMPLDTNGQAKLTVFRNNPRTNQTNPAPAFGCWHGQVQAQSCSSVSD